MSTPYLRTKALVQAKEFLWELMEAESDKGPPVVREAAHRIQQHFPTLLEIQQIHEELPDLLGPVPPVGRLRGSPETLNVIEATRAAEP